MQPLPKNHASPYGKKEHIDRIISIRTNILYQKNHLYGVSRASPRQTLHDLFSCKYSQSKEKLSMYFPTAEISCHPVLPFAVAAAVSFFTSMGGVSGAFLLLPFQMSVLGYTNPSVSATNQFFNIVACPAGVLRYWREGRLLWPVALTIALGTLPGVFLGALIRLNWLPDPQRFKLFAGAVLLYIGCRMAFSLRKGGGPDYRQYADPYHLCLPG